LRSTTVTVAFLSTLTLMTLLGAAINDIPPTAQAGVQSTPVPVPATPTIDRLAPPPTVASPTQADDGAQLFWLHCQPCHGDRGQGLTDEWRAQYPPEDQNCWESGCHGDRPYESGFTLPESVPAVIGDGSLARFDTLGQVLTFSRSAMPLQDPGHLTEEEYLAIVAFLGRAHAVANDIQLDAENVHSIRLRESAATGPEANPGAGPGSEPEAGREIELFLLVGGFALFLFIVGGIWLWRRFRM
jgi:mono/diheme cytochrome c family protein